MSSFMFYTYMYMSCKCLIVSFQKGWEEFGDKVDVECLHGKKYMYRSVAKMGPLWIVRPPPNFATISFCSLKLTCKSAHVAQALQIGNSHCLTSLRLW